MLWYLTVDVCRTYPNLELDIIKVKNIDTNPVN